jgi:hypothetical protein
MTDRINDSKRMATAVHVMIEAATRLGQMVASLAAQDDPGPDWANWRARLTIALGRFDRAREAYLEIAREIVEGEDAN